METHNSMDSIWPMGGKYRLMEYMGNHGINRDLEQNVFLPSQSPSAAWMGGFGAQRPQGQAPPPVIPPPDQAGYGMASYQTQ